MPIARTVIFTDFAQCDHYIIYKYLGCSFVILKTGCDHKCFEKIFSFIGIRILLMGPNSKNRLLSSVTLSRSPDWITNLNNILTFFGGGSLSIVNSPFHINTRDKLDQICHHENLNLPRMVHVARCHSSCILLHTCTCACSAVDIGYS